MEKLVPGHFAVSFASLNVFYSLNIYFELCEHVFTENVGVWVTWIPGKLKQHWTTASCTRFSQAPPSLRIIPFPAHVAL